MEEIPKQLRHPDNRFILVRAKDKLPIEKDWQNTNNYPWDHPKIKAHLKAGGNLGILTGVGDIVVFDCDTIEAEWLARQLGNTFVVTTSYTDNGYLKKHFYFNSSLKKKQILMDHDSHLGEVQAKGQFIVCPGSVHPSGRVYAAENGSEIRAVDEQVIMKTISPFVTASRSKPISVKSMKSGAKEGSRNDTAFRLATFHRKAGATIEEAATLLEDWNNKKNDPPLVDSEIETIVKSAYRGDKAYGIYFKENPMEGGISDKPQIEMPHEGKIVKRFVEDLIPLFGSNLQFFYKPNENRMVEIRPFFDKINKKDVFGFKTLESKRLINLFETRMVTGLMKYNKDTKESFFKEKTISQSAVEIIMENQDFIDSLNNVNRFFTCTCPFILDDGKLFFAKRGYNPEIEAFVTEDSPDIAFMTVEDAKDVLVGTVSEFCFKDAADKEMAISYLLTPACRGLYNNITNRTPLYLIKGNRPGTGKDYLAGVVGIIYEGRAIDDPPLTRDNNEEVGKKITAALIQGRKRMHFSNCKGYLNNSYLEQALTSENSKHRILGKSEEVELPNEMDFSVSANVGLKYPADLWRRCRSINLFYAEEDINARRFKRPDLHNYINMNRGKILSAIFTLIKDWHEAGMPSGNTFASFPEWARVVGGIMKHHGLGDPCVTLEDDAVGGDSETTMMKEIFAYLWEKRGTDAMKVKDIREAVAYGTDENNLPDAPNIFFDVEDKEGKVRFGLLIKKFAGRILGDIKLELCEGEELKPSFRKKYRFTNVGEKL